MQNEIRWLARLGLDQGLFTLAQFNAVRAALPTGADLMAFAQQLIDDAHVPDDKLEILERVAGLALAKGKAGPPYDDPFEDEPAPVSAVSKTSPKPAGTTAPPFMATAGGAPAKQPAMPAEALNLLGDDALASTMRRLLRECSAYGASDLHLSAGSPPFIRHNRKLIEIAPRPLDEEEARRLNTILLQPAQRDRFDATHDLDFALGLPSGERYRVNLMVHKGGVAGAYRMVPSRVPKLSELGLNNPEPVRKLLSYHNGLILVTGPVGAGKTTTLAALVNELNQTREDHVITVEDPVEVVQASAGCNLTQREVGTHTATFASALKGALREDPDVIVIGELRDLETIEMAISASETGHLVIGTMHTSDAATTLNRLLDVFPASQQTQIRASVAESLRGILCQRLLPSTEGGLLLANELLISNTAVAALIREGKTQGLRNVLETGVRDGMSLMENVVHDHYKAGRITAATARQNITSKMMLAKIH